MKCCRVSGNEKVTRGALVRGVLGGSLDLSMMRPGCPLT